MPTNDFLTFASGPGANVITLPTYTALSARGTGFQAGIAQSSQLNRVWRQSSIIAAMLAQFIADYSGQNSVDDGTIATLEQNLKLAIQAITRVKATAPVNVYVSTAGNDANTGLTIGSPFRNIATALNFVYHNFDFNGFPVTVNIAAGTYNENLVISGMPSAASVVNLLGVPNTPTSVSIVGNTNPALIVNRGTIINLDGVQFSAPGAGNLAYGLSAIGADVTLNNVAFGTCGWGQCSIINGLMQCAVGSRLTFSGASTFGMLSRSGSELYLTGATLIFVGTPTYSQQFLVASQHAEIQLVGMPAATGHFTGRSFLANVAGNFNSQGSATGIAFLNALGTIAGITDAATFGLFV